MKTAAEQFAGLDRLAKLIALRECNVLIRPAGADVAYLYAANTPGASQIVYADTDGGYDVWPMDGPKRFGLTIEQAVEVVAAEYLLAKAARIKQRHPDVDVKRLLKILRKGYQRKG